MGEILAAAIALRGSGGRERLSALRNIAGAWGVARQGKVDGKWKVYESLGLSEYVNSDIHKFNQKIGCNGFNDIELARNSIINKAQQPT